MSPLPPGAPSRFDAILLAIGLAVAMGFSASLLPAVSLQVGGGVGSLVAVVAMVDGLVRNPPVE